ncbi:MAG: hypothetical protein GX647_03900 [Clostridiales bacterium]|jgi:hypothetical protein|nr:hypothetical protein [Clostridiales bacterium]
MPWADIAAAVIRRTDAAFLSPDSRGGPGKRGRPILRGIGGAIEMLHEQLKRIVEEGSLASLYSDSDDTEKFSVGRIKSISDRYVLIESFDEAGKYDGYALKQADDIFLLEKDTRYLKKIRCLMGGESRPAFPEEGADGLHSSLLGFARDNNLVVSVQMMKSGVVDACGFVRGIEEDCVEMELVNAYGESDGRSYFSPDCISQAVCDGTDEQIIKTLYGKHGNGR